MSKPMGAWASRVHAHYLAAGGWFTAAEAIAMFGNPQGRGSAASVLNREQGAFEASAEGYRALEVEGVDVRVQRRRVESWFDGLKRVRWVFELGDSL